MAAKRKPELRPDFADERDNPIVRLDAAMRAEGVPLLLTLHEAAKILRLHYQSIWAHVQRGSLKAHKQRGHWRIVRLDLARWSLQGGADAL